MTPKFRVEVLAEKLCYGWFESKYLIAAFKETVLVPDARISRIYLLYCIESPNGQTHSKNLSARFLKCVLTILGHYALKSEN